MEKSSRATAESAETTRLHKLTGALTQLARIDGAFTGLESRLQATAKRATHIPGSTSRADASVQSLPVLHTPAAVTAEAGADSELGELGLPPLSGGWPARFAMKETVDTSLARIQRERAASRLQIDLEQALQEHWKQTAQAHSTAVTTLNDIGIRLRAVRDALPRLDGQLATLQDIVDDLAALPSLVPFDCVAAAAWLEALPGWRAIDMLAASVPRPVQCFIQCSMYRRFTIVAQLSINTSVAQLADMVQEREGFPSSAQLYFWRGKVVDDYILREALRQGIDEGGRAIFELALRPDAGHNPYLRVKTPHSEFLVEINLHTTVGDVKGLLYENENLPIEQQQLITASGQLPKDSMPLARVGVRPGSLVYLDLRLTPHPDWGDDPPDCQTSVRHVDIRLAKSKRKRFRVDASPDTTIATIKQRVAKKLEDPDAQMRLIAAGRELRNQYTAANYSIQDGDTLHVCV